MIGCEATVVFVILCRVVVKSALKELFDMTDEGEFSATVTNETGADCEREVTMIRLGEGRVLMRRFSDSEGGGVIGFSKDHDPETVGTVFDGDGSEVTYAVFLRCANIESARVLQQLVSGMIAQFEIDAEQARQIEQSLIDFSGYGISEDGTIVHVDDGRIESLADLTDLIVEE